METVWPTKPKIFTSWPLTEKVCWSLLSLIFSHFLSFPVFQKDNVLRHLPRQPNNKKIKREKEKKKQTKPAWNPLQVHRFGEVGRDRGSLATWMSLPPDLIFVLQVPLRLGKPVRWVSPFPTQAKLDSSTWHFENQGKPHLPWAIPWSCQCLLQVHPARACTRQQINH